MEQSEFSTTPKAPGLDLEIYEKALKGDEQAFEKLYITYKGYVYRTCASFLKSNGIAEELTQDVFLKVRDTIVASQPRNFPAWLYTVARNCCLDYRRRHRVEFRSINFEDEEVKDFFLNKKSEGLNPEEELVQKQNEKELNKVLEFLTPREKNIFKLKTVSELTFREIAEQTNTPLRTTAQIYYNLLGKIAKKFNIPQDEIPNKLKKGYYKTREGNENTAKYKKQTLNQIEEKFSQHWATLDKLNERIYYIPKRKIYGIVSEPFPDELLGVKLQDFRRLRNKLPKKQNLALQFVYEYGIYNDKKKLADVLYCEMDQVDEIIKLAEENFERLQKNEPLLKSSFTEEKINKYTETNDLKDAVNGTKKQSKVKDLKLENSVIKESKKVKEKKMKAYKLRILDKLNSKDEEIYEMPYYKRTTGSKEVPSKVLGVSLEYFIKIRNKLPEQQNLALKFFYEYGIRDDADKLAELIDCEPQELGKILKLAKENFEKLK